MTEGLLEQPKAPVGEELRVAHYQEGKCDLFVEINQHYPCQVLHHVVVLILARAIVSMKVKVGLSQIVGLQEVVYHADDVVGPFTGVYGFVNKVIDLLKHYLLLIKIVYTQGF